jgi:hypothetical protein
VSSAGREEGTLEGRGWWGFTGVEDRLNPGPVVYQSSKPGATTPMAGISRGPGMSWKSSAGVGSARLEAADTPPAFAVGRTVVCAMARSDAIVSAVAPAPSTEAAGEERWSALCLPTDTAPLPERQRSILEGSGTHGPPHRRSPR